MRIGGSLFLIAIGAVLRWAVTYRSPDVNVPAVGMILIVVGAVGLIATLVLWATHRGSDVVAVRDDRRI